MIINNVERKVFWIVIDVAVFLLLFISFVLSVFTLKNNKLPLEYLDAIQENWSLSPIQEIKAKEKDAACDPGFEILVFDQWLGTKEGCNCLNIRDDDDDRLLRNLDRKRDYYDDDDDDDDDDDERKIYRRRCSSHQIRMHCTNIPGNPKVKITYLDETQLCVKRSNEIRNYKEILKYSNEDKGCKQGYQPCGALDRLNQIYCLPNGRVCPINYIKLSTSQNYPDSVHKFSQIKLGNLYYLYTSNEFKSDPLIVSFKLSEGQVCINPSEINSQYPPYTLDVNAEKYKCSTVIDKVNFDNRYIILTEMRRKEIYDQNQITSKLFSLINYPTASIYAFVNLYYRNYIGCEKECVEDNDLTKISKKEIEDNWKEVKQMQIVSCSFLTCAIIFLIVLISIKACKKYKLNVCTNVCEGILILICSIVFFMAATTVAKLNAIDLDIDCKEDITDLWFDDLTKNIKSNKGLNVVIMVFALLPMLLYPIDCVLNLFCKSQQAPPIVNANPQIGKRDAETHVYEQTANGEDKIDEKYGIELPVLEHQIKNTGEVLSVNSMKKTPTYNRQQSNISAPAFPNNEELNQNTPSSVDNEQLDQHNPTVKNDLIDNTNLSKKKNDNSIVNEYPNDL